ncbi:AI-2E family transporter [Lachnospiraceae bacterium NSJ-143]|nr:AI-2E family transporter [Lachnospiraceae bacterium NSJ-143]
MELIRDNFKKLAVIVLIGILFFWSLNNYKTVLGSFGNIVSFFTPFIMGLCFAFVVNVLLRLTEKTWSNVFKNRRGRIYTKLKRPLCLIISLIIIIGVIFVILFIIVPELNRTVSSAIDMLPEYVGHIESWWGKLSDELKAYSIVLPQFELNPQEIGNVVRDFLNESGNYLINKTFEFTASVISLVVNIILGLVFSIYILLGKEKLARQCVKVIYAFLPRRKAENVLGILRLSNRVFTNFITGQFTEAVIIGILCFVGMSFLRIPYPAMISILVGFTALIPVFGAFIGTIIGVFLILMVSPVKALWFVIFIIILQQLEGDLIYPRVVGKSVGLPGIWVLLAVTVGGSALGFLGMLLSVPVCSVLYTVFAGLVSSRLNKKNFKIEN